MKETVYTSDSQLAAPRIFFGEIIADLKTTRELGWRLFITNLRSQYRQSLLGYVWMVVPPLLTSLIWIFLSRANVISSLPANIPYPVFVLTGVFIWQTFVDTVNCPLRRLSVGRSILSKVKVPHEAFILAGLGEILYNLAVRMLILLIALMCFGFLPSASMLLAPLGLFALLALGLGIGFMLTPLGILYSDISNALNLGITFWFFLTPIVYTISPENSYSFLIKLNPVTPLIVTTRNWLTIGFVAPESGFVPVTILAVCWLTVSWLFYRLAKPHLIARL